MRQETVYLEPQAEKRQDDDRYVRERISKYNTGHFYVSLHRALFGGKMSPRYRGQHETLDSGQLINGDPDINRIHNRGKDIVEVKSASWKDRRPSFTPEQIRNHSYKFSQRLLDSKDNSPDLELAIYLFGKEKKYPFLFGYSASKSAQILCKYTDQALIMPSNVFYALVSSLIVKELDKTASKSQTAGIHMNRPSANIINSMMSLDNPLEKLLSNLQSKEHENPEALKKVTGMLRLEETKFKDYSSSDITDLRIRVIDGEKEGKYQVKPFPIRKFYLPAKAKKEWLNDFKKNHRMLLEEVLGVADLYFEQNEAYETYERPDHLRTDWDKIEQTLLPKLDNLPF
jgi:hypothetical protein